MHIAIYGDDTAGRTLDDIVERARIAEEQGFAGFYLPQIFGLDAITTLVLVGQQVPRIQLGTTVVPIYTHHPIALAQQALTAQIATGGRFMLGIGLSHQWVVETLLGLSFERPVRHMREYLSVLVPLVQTGSVSFAGETIRAQGVLDIAGAAPCPIVLAALGTQMLELAGAMADGTITWMTGPATLEAHTIPTITAAAERAGRPTPMIAASLPVCVTDDPDSAREHAARAFQAYGMLPSYRAMLDREGAAGPGDVAIVGNEAAVGAAVAHLAEIGVTHFAAAEYGRREYRTRTRALLRTLL